MGKKRQSGDKVSSTPPDTVPDVTKESQDTELKSPAVPIVGVGASAGGLDALERLFGAMPVETGFAFVLVTHLDPDRASLLPELLQRKTAMPVRQVSDGVRIQPNCLYIIAPKMELSVRDGTLHTVETKQPRSVTLPIDSFLTSLADDQASNAVAIILSGTGSDGTEGVKAIKSAGGMVMVQDTESAQFDGMPRSVIAAQLADFVLPPEELPEKLVQYLVRILGHRSTRIGDDAALTPPLQKIFVLLRTRTEHDFSEYKRNTIVRRIERRMNVHQLDDIDEYVRYLRESDREAAILVKELLINVTSFFRDSEAFAYLKSTALPELLAAKRADGPVRVWVNGCATGEEAYSIAILLHECMEKIDKHFTIQVFGTDADPHSIQTARTGVYSRNISDNVSPERLERYFLQLDDGRYRIGKMIREMLVFAPQNVIKDPPFTKLDLLCCRNLLIYFQPELQKRLLPVFHYSLRENGLMFLGSSESIGQHTDLFTSVHKKWKIFRKTQTRTPSSALTLSSYSGIPETPMESRDKSPTEFSDSRYMELILNHSAAPPCAIIDAAHNIIFIHGRTGKFLEPAEGKASANILDMARSGIKAELASAIRQIGTDRQPIVRHNLEIGFNGDRICINLTVTPLEHGPSRGAIMVVFEETDTTAADPESKSAQPKPSGKSLEQVERELRDTRENLQTVMEEMQAANEELKSTNEELQSTNEELQSTNEELETSKEELQSLNEESVTVNAELQSQIEELSKTADDMKNLLDSTDVATVFLDSELRIRGYTPRATDLIPLEETDDGRLISHFAHDLRSNIDLAALAELVLNDLVVRETEVTSNANNIYLLRARPYRTAANMIDGVVLTFENVTELKRVQELLLKTSLDHSEDRYLRVIRECADGVVLSNHSGDVLGVNPAFCKFLGYSESELLTMQVMDFTHSDSADETAKQLEAGRVPAKTFQMATFEKKFVHKDGSTVPGRVTVTWHCDVDPEQPMHSISFVTLV